MTCVPLLGRDPARRDRPIRTGRRDKPIIQLPSIALRVAVILGIVATGVSARTADEATIAQWLAKVPTTVVHDDLAAFAEREGSRRVISLDPNLRPTVIGDVERWHPADHYVLVDDKLRIAEQLDWLGVHWIEGGYPMSNPKDEEFFRRAPTDLKLTTSTLVAFGSTRKPLGKSDDDPTLRALVKKQPVDERTVAETGLRVDQLQDLVDRMKRARFGGGDAAAGVAHREHGSAVSALRGDADFAAVRLVGDGDFETERFGLFGRDRIGKAPANVVAVVFVTPARRMNGADAHSDPRWLGAAAPRADSSTR